MPSIENKNQSAKEQLNSKAESKEQKNTRFAQTITEKAFKEFSIDEKTSIAALINKYLKLPKAMEPRELFQKLVEIKKNNPNNPRLAQIIINNLRKIITKKENDLKVLQIRNEKGILNWKKLWKNKVTENQDPTSLTNDDKINKKLDSQSTDRIKLQKQVEHIKQLQSSLKPEYQPTQAQITAKVQSLSPETKAKLKSSGLSETDYAKLLASKDSLFSAGDTSQESRDFLDSLKELNQSLGIRDLDQMPNSFSVDKQFFKDNPDLVKHIWESPDFKTLDNSFDLSRLKNFKEVSTFVEKFGDENLKRLKNQISPFFDEEWRLKQITSEERKIFETFFSSFQAIKQQMTWVSTNMLKAWAMQAPIVALYQYLDEPSLWLENLNQQNRKIWDRTEFSSEWEDQIMTFQGTIDGKPINFYFNLTNGKLQCDDHINFNNDQNHISIGENTRTDLNIQLPNQQELIAILKDRFTPELQQDLIKNSANMQEYHQNLNQLIASTLQETFNIDPLIRSRISMQTEKNLTSQEFSNDFLPPHLAPQLQNEKIINNNLQIKKLFQILDFISENSTSDQLMSMRKSFKKLTSLISSHQELEKIADPIIKEQFIKLHESLQNTSTIANRTETMFSFLQIFIKKDFSKEDFNPHTLPDTDIFNFIDLENFLKTPLLDKDLATSPYYKNFSEPFNKRYFAKSQNLTENDAQTADKQLEAELLAFA